MNTQIFIFINNWAGRWGWLDSLMIFCAEYLWYLLVLGVLWLAVRNWKHWRDMAIVSIGSAVVARFGVAELIRHFYYHARPYWVLAQTHLLLAKETESSFPSGHTIFVFALAMGVYIYNKRIGKWYLWLGALVGFARIFVGIHWPYDIIAGAILGVLTAWIGDKIYRKYKYVVGL
jgi:undecaprenyl-diphosphatase